MAPLRPLVYYITAHGYGHGVRSTDILTAFHARRPDIPVVVVSDLPESFLSHRLPEGACIFRDGAFDVGMVQRDSIRVDVPETLSQVLDLDARWDQLISEEEQFLQSIDAAMVVADIPAIPLEAAAARGLPRVAVGNFAWDWIYSAFHHLDPRWEMASDRFALAYGLADVLLRLPFSEEMSAFPIHEPIGVVAKPGQARRKELQERTGCSPDKPWVLLSFTTLEWDEEALNRVAGSAGIEFFTVLPLEWERPNLHAIRREDISFSDVVASVDAVISKPGFGLLSDCIANKKPLLYAERTDFIEYPILVDAVERYLKNLHIPAEALYRGDLEPYLEQLWSQPEPLETIAQDGGEVAARHLEGYYERGN